ncbi:hypothetical protein F2Q70_00014153 [Brassica cretica]|uniref:Uncharacterized protein n=1 Tax=Brassica cretica TaxID=69181 RepID=A0A8S9I4J1_BRACR|nr:hypothetical protein F2Q70_00014153 [Brassica cretica]
MIINLATLLVNAVNGDQEPASFCVDRFGSGAYPGYAGRVLVDKTTGASYNALGLAGRKYLLPAVCRTPGKNHWFGMCFFCCFV